MSTPISMLIVILLAIPMSAGVRGAIEPTRADRVGLALLPGLPPDLARRLASGVREGSVHSAPVRCQVARIGSGDGRVVRHARPLREALLDLPPPALPA
jgi:hypothetical protein